MYQKYAIKLPRENAIIEEGKIEHKDKEGIIVKQDEYVTAVTWDTHPMKSWIVKPRFYWRKNFEFPLTGLKDIRVWGKETSG